MCGIAGVVARGGRLDVERERANVGAMLAAMAHRGPDDESLADDQQRVVLGFRRLSIIDVAGGRQPISSEDGRVLAIANGEIYNHRELRDRLASRHAFRSHSDCEVIPHLYEEHGLGFVEHLNGMYGIALWDAKEQRLVLARDHLGVKPLYFHVTRDAVIFSSELKGLFAHPEVPVELDWPHALEFLHRRWIGAPNQRPTSWFKGISYLPAGHVLTVASDGAIADRAYWSLPRELVTGRTEQQWIDGYRELLDDSVRLQLAADVEVGLFLSGGIDSVAIAQLARHHGEFHTFSIASLGTYETGDLQAAADAAAALRVHHHEALMDDGFALTVESWRDLLRIVEQPLCTVEQLFKFRLHRFAKAVRPELKVILLGQGSDEFNGGYGNFWLARNAPAAPRDWDTFITSVRRSQLRALATHGNPSLLKLVEMFPEPVLKRDYVASFGHQAFEDDPWIYYLDMQRHMLQRFNLWHEDRTAAANSIENRVPFLDRRLVEYTARIPPDERGALLWDKAILRKGFTAELADRFVSRPKVPFVTMTKSLRAVGPIWDLLQADDYAIIDAALEQGDARHIFDRDALRTTARTMRERVDIDWIMMLLSMCFMEQAMRDTRPVQPSSIPVPPVLEASARDGHFARWTGA